MSAITHTDHLFCNTVIHTASTATAGVGAGLAQLPGSDSVPIMGIQTTMLIALGAKFGKSIAPSDAVVLITTYLATLAGRAISQWLIGWVPGIGNLINAATAFSITEVMGWHFAEQFAGEAVYSSRC